MIILLRIFSLIIIAYYSNNFIYAKESKNIDKRTKQANSFKSYKYHSYLKVLRYSDALHGHKTSSGEPYHKNKLTAASLHFPLGTVLLLKNPQNNKTCIVKINDKGPYTKYYDLDLSSAAFKKLGLKDNGRILCYSNYPFKK